MSNHAASTRPPKCLSLESKAHRKARLFHTSGTWVPPQYSPSDTTSARSPLAVLFCSALALRRGSGHALSKSFAFFCASRNARVTGFALRGHQVIYAKSPTAHIRYSLVPSQYSPSTGQALAHRSRSRKGQSPKSAVIRGLHNNMLPTTSARNPFGAKFTQNLLLNAS